MNNVLRIRPLGRLGIVGAVLGAAAVLAPAASAQAVKPVNIRIVGDMTAPPHPAAIAMEYFGERIKELIPGSEYRTYYAGALYTIPQAVEAMTEGNLEMAWGQYGKTAQIDKYMSVVVGPQLMSTPGAMNQLDNFETIKMLNERFDKIHNIHVFGTAHMSMFMGAGSGSRLLKPEDFAGKKIRSMGPAENAALSAWGANPTTMAFGDVPPALQTGVIDGLLTSLGGFNTTKDQAPYFTVAGINGITGDYYWIGAGNTWWNSLDAAQKKIIEETFVNEIIPFQKKVNWCNDKRLIDQYETKDPTKPGIYIMNDAEAKALSDKLGNASTEWKKKNTPPEADEWVDKFVMEAKAAVEKNPIGSDPLEKTNCADYAQYFTKYLQKK